MIWCKFAVYFSFFTTSKLKFDLNLIWISLQNSSHFLYSSDYGISGWNNLFPFWFPINTTLALNPEETSPEVQNMAISGPTKGTYVLQKILKTPLLTNDFSLNHKNLYYSSMHVNSVLFSAYREKLDWVWSSIIFVVVQLTMLWRHKAYF